MPEAVYPATRAFSRICPSGSGGDPCSHRSAPGGQPRPASSSERGPGWTSQLHARKHGL